MRLGIIIQARMGSSRLPGKILMPIGGKPLLKHILYRLSFLKSPAKAVVATTNLPGDDVVEKFCIAHSIACFRGSEEDVLNRYRLCAREFGFEHIVRLTADNPFPDITALDELIALYFRKQADYAHSFSAHPIGVGSEIFSLEALERSYVEGLKPHHREHVNEYMLENPELFKTVTLPSTELCQPCARLTVDTDEDYRRACFIVDHSPDEYVTTDKALALAELFAECEAK